MLERCLIEHCSPTLACIKTANLINISYSDEASYQQELDGLNEQLGAKGVSIITLRKRQGRALIYICRKKRLAEDLKKQGVEEFLRDCGYEDISVEGALETLKRRLAEDESFPHEIGIFLSYPLGDVLGFIENAGKNSKCIGCWMVYCNVCQAQKIFASYKRCKEVYMKLWNEGKSVMQLTVAA